MSSKIKTSRQFLALLVGLLLSQTKSTWAVNLELGDDVANKNVVVDVDFSTGAYHIVSANWVEPTLEIYSQSAEALNCDRVEQFIKGAGASLPYGGYYKTQPVSVQVSLNELSLSRIEDEMRRRLAREARYIPAF